MALNWGHVSDGGVFESMVHCLLFAEDAGTLLFGRPGRDGAQDARSSNGKIVYQAKFKSDGFNMDGVVNCALEELVLIRNYKNPMHPNYKHWKFADTWVMVANIKLNPNDDSKWKTKVVPKFEAEGLKAVYWSKERLEQELVNHPWIAEVFFEGENRVLIGLKEARDLLEGECVEGSFEIPLVGRESELSTVIDFVTKSDMQILPIVGPVGIGKSRLLYESLILLADQGWRTLWGLPNSMSRSSKWFRLLNGVQKTVVVLDDMAEQSLLRGMVEQLATTERKNWKVLVSCAPAEQEVLRELTRAKLATDPVTLTPLGETDAKQLVSRWYKSKRADRDYQIYKLSNGIPGWIALVGASFRSDKLEELPASLDHVAGLYVRHCIDKLAEIRHEEVMAILRWLALWERLAITPDSEQQLEVQFLKTEYEIPFKAIQKTLTDLVTNGLVKNFGIGKRFYSIGQLIVRQQILSEWLLEKEGDDYVVSAEGIRLVKNLAHLKTPNPDSIMSSLAQLSCTRLDDSMAGDFLKPVFDQFKEIVRKESVVFQYRVLDLVEKGGTADPELALEVLIETRKSEKPDQEVDSFWGKLTYTHRQLVGRIPWLLYCLAEFVRDSDVARRFLKEFEWLLLNTASYELTLGKEPAQLLNQILRSSTRKVVFGKPAFDMAIGEIGNDSKWPFTKVLVEALMNPSQEDTVFTALNTVSFQRSVILTNDPHWNAFQLLRKTCFQTLENSTSEQQRVKLWDSLRNAHFSLSSAASHSILEPKHIAEFDKILVADLMETKKILELRGQSLQIAEAVAARRIWEWYLKFGSEDKERFVSIARDCEKLFRKLSIWNFQSFFSYDQDENVARERERVAEHLSLRKSAIEIVAFFRDAENFLRASEDLSTNYDPQANFPLVEKCIPSFSLKEMPTTPVDGFVRNFLRNEDFCENEFTFSFVLKLIQAKIKELKDKGADYIPSLKIAMEWSSDEGKLLAGIYAFPHPDNLGDLHVDELDLLLLKIDSLEPVRQFQILAPFLKLASNRVLSHLDSLLSGSKLNQREKGDCILAFVRIITTMSKWWEWEPSLIPADWIFESIIKYELSGELLEDYQLSSIPKIAGYKLPISKLCLFVRSRAKFDRTNIPFDRFEIFPHDFKVADWCGNQTDSSSFSELCELTQGKGFVATYLIPKWIATLDPSGRLTADFVARRLQAIADFKVEELAQLASLAASHPDDSNAWKEIAGLICNNVRDLSRDDREYIFSCLANNDVEAFYSMPGEVAGRYHDAVRRAEQLLSEEPSNSSIVGYRKREVEKARLQLERELERIEEGLHG